MVSIVELILALLNGFAVFCVLVERWCWIIVGFFQFKIVRGELGYNCWAKICDIGGSGCAPGNCV